MSDYVSDGQGTQRITYGSRGVRGGHADLVACEVASTLGPRTVASLESRLTSRLRRDYFGPYHANHANVTWHLGTASMEV